jgi:hypothetical protein
MSHTPGPWQVMDNSRTLLHVERQEDGEAVCSVPRGKKGAANASLIAAAPDLLAALKALRGDSWRHTVDWGPRDERHAIEEQCDAAIAKAEGTSTPVERTDK